VIAQDLSDVLLATIADRAAVEAVRAKGLKAGDPFDMDVGGLADESAGHPVRIRGTIARVAQIADRLWVSVTFGRGNVVLISEYHGLIVKHRESMTSTRSLRPMKLCNQPASGCTRVQSTIFEEFSGQPVSKPVAARRKAS
jgi:microcystin degradation protein MlrC